MSGDEPALAEALRRAAAIVEPAFTTADRQALRNQSRHRLLVDIVAITGAITVLAGIAPLSGVLSPTAVRMATVLAAGTAVIAVALGIIARLHGRWLLERHRAERLRLLQFEALIEPALEARPDLDRWDRTLAERCADLEQLDRGEMHAWLARDRLHDREADPDPADLHYLNGFVRQFALAFIGTQEVYFLRRAARNERNDVASRWMQGALFFISVGAMIPAATIRLTGGSVTAANAWTLLAAGAPAISGMIRHLRSAHEYSRNGARFRAKYVALQTLRDRLCEERTPRERVRDLRLVAEHFEAEHREWLRLMVGAAWY